MKTGMNNRIETENKPRFSLGERVYVASMHPSHSIYKKNLFLHRVVVVISISSSGEKHRYCIAQATNIRTKMHIYEEHLEEIKNQHIESSELFALKSKTVRDIPKFDEKILNRWKTPQDIQDAYKQTTIDLLTGKSYSYVRVETLIALFEKAGIPTPEIDVN